MISLDQIVLLEQKIESAVAKIQQLQAENDALRNKCAELTNALSAKSEQLSSFETDQNQIEAGIKKALDRLNAIENSVLKAEALKGSIGQAASPIQNTVQTNEQPVHLISHDFGSVSSEGKIESPSNVQTPAEPKTPVEEQVSEPSFEAFAPSFDTMDSLDSNTEDTFESEEPFEPEEDNQDGLGFDIF